MGRIVWLIAGFWPLVVLGQGPPPKSDPAPASDTLASIQAEAKSASDSRDSSIRSQFRSPGKRPHETETRAIFEAYHARLLGLMDRALTLARSHPGEFEAFAAPAWVLVHATPPENDDIAGRADAALRLLADAPVLDDPVIIKAMVCADALGPRCPEIEPFLRSVLSRSRNPDLVAIARYSLGRYLAELARMPDRLASPFSGPRMTKELTRDRLDRYRAIDGPKLRGEAESLLEQVVRHNDERRIRLRERAEGELYRIRHLRIGQPAPELVGEDLDGVPIRLSDFRGKVVFFSYWATEYVPYPVDIEKLKDLVAAMKGRPFAMVWVNGDAAEDRAKAKEVVAKEGVTWRSFWAAGRDMAILREWGFDGWSTAYTIDAEGIIRDDQFGELTPAAFEPLVQTAEKAGR